MKIEKILIPKIRVAVDARLSTEALRRAEPTIVVDEVARTMVVRLETYLHVMGEDQIRIFEKHPSNWWEHFKERWLPKWALLRWPVDYKVIDIIEQRYERVCPHIQDKGQDSHLRWLCAIGREKNLFATLDSGEESVK